MALVSGYKWGSPQLGSPGGVITWSIAGAGLGVTAFHGWGFPVAATTSSSPYNFFTFDFEATLRSAFTAWSNAANIEFIQVEDSNLAAGSTSFPDIRIFFGVGDGQGGAYDGLGFYPGTGLGGDIFFDLTPTYNSDPNYFLNLALHEIGHAIGLGHEFNVPAVMHPNFTVNGLQPDDIAGAQSTYGAQDFAPPIYNLPSGQLTLTVRYGIDGLTINGNASNNSIFGSSFSEVIRGGPGDDVIAGGLGNDILDGGTGFDVALFNATFAASSWSLKDGMLVINSADGTDSLINFEQLQFTDQNADARPRDTAAAVLQIFDFLAGATPDQATFNYALKLIAGMNATLGTANGWNGMGASLADSNFAPQFTALYKSLSKNDFINAVTAEVFGSPVNTVAVQASYDIYVNYFAAFPIATDPTGEVRAKGYFIADMLHQASDINLGVYNQSAQVFLVGLATGTADYGQPLFV